MKTNQNMIRKMGDYDIVQRTKDGFFNATHLSTQWNRKMCTNKTIDDYLANKSTKELVTTIIEQESLNTQNSGYLKSGCKSDESINTRNLAYLSSRGKHGGTWMNPVLFIDYAMWLNPKFKYFAIKFMYDEMIKYRHEAGDEYRNLGSAIKKIVHADLMQIKMKKIGEALNYIVFNNHETGIRNMHGDEQKQRELSMLEKKVSDLINEGFLTNFDAVLNYLRRLYNDKNYPKVFKPA